MNAAQFDRVLRQASFFPTVTLMAAAVALFLGVRETSSTVQLIEQADQCISEATLLQKLMVDEESGLRGYQVTGDRRFLSPMHDAEAPLAAAFVHLHGLLHDYPNDLADLDALARAHYAWHDGFASPVISTLEGGGKTADVELNLLGKTAMDGLRADVETIIHDSAVRREERITRWRRQTGATLVAILAMAAGLSLLLGRYIRSRLREVSKAYGAVQVVLRQRADELFVSEQNLRTTLASICDGVITCDASGTVQMMNQIAQELTGWSQAQASGHGIDEVFRVVEELTRRPVESPASLVQRQKRPVHPGGCTLLVSRAGKEMAIDNNAAPIMDQAGVMTGIVMVFRDVTAERKTQAALLANEKLAVAGRLAATIAHEIHNPLDSVSNLLYLMESGSTPEEASQFLGMAQQELARVTQISRAMLGLYRESKAPVPIDLHETLADLLVLMERRFQTLGVSLREEVPRGLSVGGFPAELRQVFTNLITNAAEAASGQPQAFVRVSASPVAATSGVGGEQGLSGVVICIEDNGCGIPGHLHEQLFRPFFTTKGEQGTGLGLWVSQGIVHKHGGTITVESSTAEAAHGTSIRVFLADHPVIQPGSD